MDIHADLVIVSDFRFPGGTATAIASEIDALSAAGYRVALVAHGSAFLAKTRAFHPAISGQIAKGRAILVPPGSRIRAPLACLHHPAVFGQPPSENLRIDVDQAVLVVHHPPVDPNGVAQYDLQAIMSALPFFVRPPVRWAPVGPKVREAFARCQKAPPLMAEDWVNVIDSKTYSGARPGLLGARPIVGRHSRPDALKWPDTAQEMRVAYPDIDDIDVRLMGFEPDVIPELEQVPNGWQLLPFGAQDVRQFLGGIDFFSYYHSADWTEAFGRSILEAMACGVVCLLPRDFEPLFGEAAVYGPPEDVAQNVRAFCAAPETYARQSACAAALVAERFSPAVAAARIHALIGSPQSDLPEVLSPAPRPVRPRVLYLTSNGVGMGHLTRVMACARRQVDRVEPIIVSMSRAFTMARREGFLTEHIPFSRAIGMEQAQWDINLRAELLELFRFYKPRVVVLDGNVPYEGLRQALAEHGDSWAVWLRRAMWPPETGAHFLANQNSFDAVLEPGELAGAFDRGLTLERRKSARLVAPISFLQDGEALSRDAARSVLGLDPDRPALFLQLGSGNNLEINDLRGMIIEKLTRDPRHEPPQIVIGEWQIGRDQQDPPPGVTVLRNFPFARFLGAFDYAVAMAGYNTFHENLRAGLPTLFLANEHPEQDEQWLRADYARLMGCGLAARLNNPYDILRQLFVLSARTTQVQLRAGCARLPTENGADDAAAFLADLAHTGRPHQAVDPP